MRLGRTAAAGLISLFALSACGDAGTAPVATSAPADTPTPEPLSTASASPGAIPVGATCGEPFRPRLQEGSHLIGDTEPPVPWSSNPPTSGWHASGAPQLGVRDEQLSGAAFVSALEAGHVVIAWDPDAADQPTRDRLAELATTTYADQLTVTPWAPMPTAIAIAGWNVLQRCNDLDEAVLASFISDFEPADHGH